MNPVVLWVALPGFCVVVTGALVYFVMQSRMEVLLSKQREELASARAALTAQQEHLKESVRCAAESAHHRAMDDFLADIRIEERQYTREHKLLFMTRKCLVRQERIFFRNIPLSNWIEQEMPIEDGADIEKLARSMSVFVGEALAGGAEASIVKLLH